MRLLAFLLLSIAHAQIPVWIDTDPSVAPGGKEVDDGIALLQAFASREIQIRGVSVVFGNAELVEAVPIGREIVTRFGPPALPLHTGAASADMLGQETDASRALAAALRREALTVLVLGPATNVATVLRNHPELASRIQRIIAVAGRRPGQLFVAGPKQKTPFRDLNFELDPKAFQVILDSNVPFTLAPWEISAKVWLTEADFQPGAPGVNWLRPAVMDWIKLWKDRFGAVGFNPFDSLAVGVVVDPGDLLCEAMSARIDYAPGPFLHVRPTSSGGRSVTYCYGVKAAFKSHLLRRLHSK